MTIIKDRNWEYSQFSGAPTVVIAETKMRWYDEESLEDMKYELSQQLCRVFINTTEEGDRYAKRRKTVRIEIYKEYPTTSLEEKVAELKDVIKNVQYFKKSC